MKLLSIYRGNYNGHDYAKMYTQDEEKYTGLCGHNVVVSKLDLNEYERLKKEWELYEDQEVRISYNRGGRVDRTELI